MNAEKLMICMAALLISLPLLADDYGMAKGTVRFRVIDDQGDPVAGAYAIIFDEWTAKGYKGLTDSNGYFSCRMRKIYPPIGGQFTKPGYYKTQGEVWMGPFGVLPTNTLNVTLKRIVNPVPMVKREVRLLFPVLGEPVGFDFEKGDWIEPHGAGMHADVWILGQKISGDPDNLDFRASMVTSNDLNGFISFPMLRRDNGDIARSLFQPPQMAPESGYTNVLTAYRRYRRGMPLESNAIMDKDYLFRLRCVINNADEIINANFGWFYKSVDLTGFKAIERETGRVQSSKNDPVEVQRDRLWITFAYYYNPDPTSRNLEPKEIADRQ